MERLEHRIDVVYSQAAPTPEVCKVIHQALLGFIEREQYRVVVPPQIHRRCRGRGRRTQTTALTVSDNMELPEDRCITNVIELWKHYIVKTAKSVQPRLSLIDRFHDVLVRHQRDRDEGARPSCRR